MEMYSPTVSQCFIGAELRNKHLHAFHNTNIDSVNVCPIQSSAYQIRDLNSIPQAPLLNGREVEKSVTVAPQAKDHTANATHLAQINKQLHSSYGYASLRIELRKK